MTVAELRHALADKNEDAVVLLTTEEEYHGLEVVRYFAAASGELIHEPDHIVLRETT